MILLTPGSFPETLKNLLKIESFLHCGRQVPINLSRIKIFRVKLSNLFELRHAASCDELEMNGTSLEVLASKHLGLNPNKTYHFEDFYILPSPIELQQCVALDAFVSRKPGELIRHKNLNSDTVVKPDLLKL